MSVATPITAAAQIEEPGERHGQHTVDPGGLPSRPNVTSADCSNSLAPPQFRPEALAHLRGPRACTSHFPRLADDINSQMTQEDANLPWHRRRHPSPTAGNY